MRELVHAAARSDAAIKGPRRSDMRLCVLILLYVCPHTTIYVSSYNHICVNMLLASCYVCVACVCFRRLLLEMPRTTVYVSAYYCYMCPYSR